MKQAEEAKRSAIESARRAFEEYQPIKHDVDLMRTGKKLPSNLCNKIEGVHFIISKFNLVLVRLV